MARDGEVDQSSEWHLDKKVPLGLIFIILFQTITFVYFGTSWKSSIDYRLDNLEKSDSAQAPNGNRLTILEQKFDFISQTLQRIEKKIDTESERSK